MSHCRVCRAPLGPARYRCAAPALTSVTTLIDMPTEVHVCEACAHAQSPDMPDLTAFYDTEYRISLQGDEHDQVVRMDGDRPVFRTDHQAGIALNLLGLREGARVLDYGAARATTLRRMCAARPDLEPHVFDVSTDYRAGWTGWVPDENQATYGVPGAWIGRFDAVMMHFVLEHVADPVGVLAEVSRLLAPGGKLLVSVPDFDANPGDLLVCDHLNHFSAPSLALACRSAGLALDRLDTARFPGAFFAVMSVAGSGAQAPMSDSAAVAARAVEHCRFWAEAATILSQAAAARRGRQVAIYGAGFYGSWIYARIASEATVVAFLDRNPKLAGSTLFERTVLAPDRLPEGVDTVFVGLNPLKARALIAEVDALSGRGLDFVWLDRG